MTNARYHFIKDSVCNFDWGRTTQRGWLNITTLGELTPEEKEIVEVCLPLPLYTPWPSFNFPTNRSLIKNYRIIWKEYDAEAENLAKKFQNQTIKISQSKIREALDSALKDVQKHPFANDEATDFVYGLLYHYLANYGFAQMAESSASNEEISASALLQGRKEFDGIVKSRTMDGAISISNRTEQGTVLIVRPKIAKAINDVIAAYTTDEEIVKSLTRQSKLGMAMDNVWSNFLHNYYRETDRLLEKHLS